MAISSNKNIKNVLGSVSSKIGSFGSDPTFEETIQDMSASNTAQTFSFNSSEAQKARDFQEYMSNTSHQREVEDLKRAGLNPVLSSNSGAMAYSASSASGSADTSSVGALASIYQTKMSNENAKQIAEMNIKQDQANNKNALEIAKINAAASNYASNMASSATRYASQQNAAAARYASNNNYAASIYGTNKSYGSTNAGMIESLGLGKTGTKVAKGVYLGSGALGNIISSVLRKGK